MSEVSYQDRPAPVAGYRDLSQEEIDLVNRIKAAEVAVGELWREVYSRPDTSRRMVAIAKTKFQCSFMWLVRSVAKPQDVFYEGSEY